MHVDAGKVSRCTLVASSGRSQGVRSQSMISWWGQSRERGAPAAAIIIEYSLQELGYILETFPACTRIPSLGNPCAVCVAVM